MSTPNDGGPAFPQALAFNANNEAVCAGMYIPDACGISIRDYFAAHIAQGMLAGTTGFVIGEQSAKAAYEQADAMLAARNSTGAEVKS